MFYLLASDHLIGHTDKRFCEPDHQMLRAGIASLLQQILYILTVESDFLVPRKISKIKQVINNFRIFQLTESGKV